MIPAPDADPGEEDVSGAAGGKSIKHSLGRLLPQKYKQVLQDALDDLTMVCGYSNRRNVDMGHHSMCLAHADICKA